MRPTPLWARCLRRVANARVYATTKEVPTDRLAVEREKLQRLPAIYILAE